jgi:hypothetical protein
MQSVPGIPRPGHGHELAREQLVEVVVAAAAHQALVEDVLDVPGDDGLVALEQLGDLPERQPGRIAIEADLHARLPVLGLVEEYVGFAWPSQLFGSGEAHGSCEEIQGEARRAGGRA